MTSDSPLLSLRRLSIRAGTRQIVSGGGLTIRRGEGVALLGPSGSGKTLTAQAILGLIQISAPELTADVAIDWPLRARSELRIGYVPQGAAESLHPYLRIGRQLTDFVAGSGPDRPMEDFRDKALKIFRELRLDEPERVFASFPHELSGGMRQRTLIAAALLCEPDLIVLDEATSSLDGLAKSAVFRCLINLKERQGTGLLVLTHDMAEAEHLTERRFVIVQQNIYSDEEVFISEPEPLRALPQLSIDAKRGQIATDPFKFKPTVFSAQDVCVQARPGDNHAGASFQVQDFSCLVRQGEGLALVGETGCGKTTTLRGLAQLAPVTAGEVRLGKVTLNKISPQLLREHRQRFQVQFQDAYLGLNPYLSVQELFEEPSWIFKSSPPTYNAVTTILARIDLDPTVMHQRCGTLSYGQRQRVAFCRSLLSFPELKLLILDEPFTALDACSRSKAIELLRDRMTNGLSAIVASHDWNLLIEITSSIIVMRHGAVVERSSVAPWEFQNPYSNLLLDAYASLRTREYTAS